MSVSLDRSVDAVQVHRSGEYAATPGRVRAGPPCGMVSSAVTCVVGLLVVSGGVEGGGDAHRCVLPTSSQSFSLPPCGVCLLCGCRWRSFSINHFRKKERKTPTNDAVDGAIIAETAASAASWNQVRKEGRTHRADPYYLPHSQPRALRHTTVLSNIMVL